MGKPGKWVVAAAVGVLLCLVSGCSGSSAQPGSTSTASSSDSPTTTATASASATPSTSATAPTAEIPADARPATIDGAQKFAAFWVSQFNLALRTADPGPIAAISTPECAACQGFISDANQLHEKGQHAESDLWAIGGGYIQSFDNAASAVVVVTVKQNPVAQVDKSGSVVSHYKERTEDVALTLKHNGSAWVVTTLQVVK